MLTCRNCLWRYISALDAAHPRTSSRAGRSATASRSHAQPRRLLQTSERMVRKVTGRPNPSGLETDPIPPEDNWRRSTQAQSLKKMERKGLTRAVAVKNDNAAAGVPSKRPDRHDPAVSTRDWRRRRRELQYLADPLELANFVKQELTKDKEEEMLQLVRMASRSMQCVVSWNHIIGHSLRKGRVSHALKIYNEMKKRAQFPDAYTYSILLTGMSDNAHDSGALAKALSVYHSMFAENSRVKPSIIHTNAMLRVCSRALDMDSLWGVAAKIPEKGPAAANSITYSTILNAIRQSLLVDVPKGESEEEVAIRRERGIMEGRRVWEEIVAKWRNAELVIGEELVCAMGRLLLVGAMPRDWDDVLSLVEQTMDIPRLVPRLGTTERTDAGLPHLRAPKVPEQFRYDDDHLTPAKGPRRGDEFLPVAPHGVESLVSSSLTYAVPGNDTLSMVMEACQKVVAKGAADKYWDVLTDPGTYGVVPDVNNLNMRLRLLRQNRSSAKAVQVLKEYFVDAGLKPRAGTLRIAMSTCVRDKNNHNSLRNAGQILEIMMETLEDADARAVTMYAELAISMPLATGADLVDALARLQPVVRSLRLQLGVGGEDLGQKVPWDKKGKGAVYLTGEQRDDAIAALRRIYGIYDKLINSNLIPEEEKAPHKAEKARLSGFLHRLNFKAGGVGEKWEQVKQAFEKEGSEAKDSLFTQKPGSWRERMTMRSQGQRPWFTGASGEAA